VITSDADVAGTNERSRFRNSRGPSRPTRVLGDRAGVVDAPARNVTTMYTRNA